MAGSAFGARGMTAVPRHSDRVTLLHMLCEVRCAARTEPQTPQRTQTKSDDSEAMPIVGASVYIR